MAAFTGDEQMIVEPPVVEFGREICGDLPAALRREWLVTNGLGGYASSTLVGINTRRYHGLLVAALHPPVERTVLVAGLIERATYNGSSYPLSANEYAGGSIDPNGYDYAQSFTLDGTLPIWIYAIGDALLEKRVWMSHGANTTWITWRLARATTTLDLEIRPLVNYRDFHSLQRGHGWHPDVSVSSGPSAEVRAFNGATSFRMATSGGVFEVEGDWYWDLFYREEAARGLDNVGDSFAVGRFVATLGPGDALALVVSVEATDPARHAEALEAERRRQAQLIEQADAGAEPRVLRQLVLASDQFIVARQGKDGDVGPTVIAGYHWFNDWGRDTMITLPGLTLATGRAEDAAAILRSYSRFLRDGLLPNNFPDYSGAPLAYNTADASLWYAVAIYRYWLATSDMRLVGDLLPVLREIAECYIAGTGFGIGVDAHDGLLRAGEPGLQLTWMDAKVGDWVITPRVGKPVEINALFYNLLRILADFQTMRGDPAEPFATRAAALKAAFFQRFWSAEYGYLADTVDGPDGDDWSLRPNQIFALSLPYPLVEGDEAAAVIATVGRDLLTTYGLRSLSPHDQGYYGDYGGDQLQRDRGYHNGPVWSWLMGPFAEAHFRVHGDGEAALSFLQPFERHLLDAGLGSISEILEGNPPHLPRGCIAQAWGVAEALRVWRDLRHATNFSS